MKQSLIAFALTGLLAIGAGVAIAGLPSDPPGGDLVITDIPTTTTTVPEAQPPVTTNPPPADETTTTAAPAPDTTALLTSTTSTTTTTLVDFIDRGDLDVVAANASDKSGVASTTADALGALGYTSVLPVDATEPQQVSTVYYRPGLEGEAARLATDLGWADTDIAPESEMPDLATERVFQLVAMIGLDRV